MFTVNIVGTCRQQPYSTRSERYGRIYETISAAFSVAFDEINHLQQTGFVNVNSNLYPIENFQKLLFGLRSNHMHVFSTFSFHFCFDTGSKLGKFHTFCICLQASPGLCIVKIMMHSNRHRVARFTALLCTYGEYMNINHRSYIQGFTCNRQYL